MTDRLDTVPAENRTLPGVVYGLYLVGLTHGLTIVVGLIIAYASRDAAGPNMRSHYIWQIRTFWLSIIGFVVGAALMLLGAPLSLILVGIPIMVLGGAICALAWLWFAVRTVLGIIHLAREEPYPRPYAIMA